MNDDWLTPPATVRQRRPGPEGPEVDDAAGSARLGTAPAAYGAAPDQLLRLATPTVAEAGFVEFYRTYMPVLVTFVMWLGAGADEATDVAQEAMMRAWAGWAGIEHPRAWVRVVASREYCRRIAACHDEPVAEIRSTLLRTGMTGADEAAMLGSEVDSVRELLRLLPARQRQVMAWVYDGYTPAETAAILNLDPATVRASLHKARGKLKHHLRGEGGQCR